MKQRNATVDYIRGIAILLVIIGHTVSNNGIADYSGSGLYRVVFALQMPLFMLVSGYVTVYSKPIESAGMLGSFITGSNMSSNILFGSFQMTTAELVGLQPAPILAAQTVGGSAGSLISPSKIVLGATTAGHPEMVGAIIRKLLPVALLFSLTSGAVVLLSGLILG